MSIILLVVAAVFITVQVLKKAGVVAPTPLAPGQVIGPGGLPQAGTSTPGGVGPGGAQRLEPGAGVQPPTGEVSPEAAAAARENKIQDMIEYTSSNPTLAPDGSGVQYYDMADNKFYKLNDAGQPVAMTQKEFFNVQNVVWSPNKNQAVLEYPDQSKIIYDFATDKQVTLPSHWQNFQFSPSGNQLVFKSLGYDPDNSWLGVVSSDGTGARTIEKIGANADKVISSWSPNNQTVAMYSEGVTFDKKTVYFVGLNGENFKSMTINGLGFMPLWSPTGSRLLYSVYSSNTNMKPLLWTSEAQGEAIGANLKPLNLETWANKCTFISDTQAYCAVPQNLPDGAGLSPTSADDIGDSLYLVDLISGQSTAIDTGNVYNMTNLLVTNDKKFIYFTDKKSGRLYKLPL